MKNVAKCDTWCELQNPVNHRVFERKLRLRPLGQGHACLGVTHRCPSLPFPVRCWRVGADVDHPLNLSISISGGKETNKDSPSNGERTGISPA
ncbi:TPA_asm: hypothetical protein HUJ06_031829 [Nelumbo nucifera]|uniref:Uncharacterized protein n=1 Tax=Nelumbo nucifera TaxID=4432 RepID=A0A822ZX82_NELNU|nr:TPA_asm: hypothetical protein HUJ06_008058 [Nelumbo nucifera]DAD37423.1 TPA_asm: hypothetical protein HUJ06_008064 [Nelumbo nucifera]DAD37427.1 TPA_asm: hypothetical protein HUJ06_008068 [Nelumbo nucifera]DAD37435.1 TPA_asm: hypothetical protein HUJ06_008076 [Nelumbo nucifera]DAD49362.1 TPA_asm: hypothetical protein HUJ06_031791 [Nelumbo nucifera]